MKFILIRRSGTNVGTNRVKEGLTIRFLNVPLFQYEVLFSEFTEYRETIVVFYHVMKKNLFLYHYKEIISSSELYDLIVTVHLERKYYLYNVHTTGCRYTVITRKLYIDLSYSLDSKIKINIYLLYTDHRWYI